MFLQTGLSATTIFYYIITVTEFEKILLWRKGIEIALLCHLVPYWIIVLDRKRSVAM